LDECPRLAKRWQAEIGRCRGDLLCDHCRAEGAETPMTLPGFPAKAICRYDRDAGADGVLENTRPRTITFLSDEEQPMCGWFGFQAFGRSA
jgi:hypothetical protein